MHHVTSRMVLKEIAPDVPSSLGCFERTLWMKVRAVSTGEALLALQNIRPAGKAAHRQFRRQQTMVGRFSCVQRFAHGPKHGFQSGSLGTGDAKRGNELRGPQPQQMRACRGRTEAADRGRGMK